LIPTSASVLILAYVSLLTGCGGDNGAALSAAAPTSTIPGTTEAYAAPHLRSLRPDSVKIPPGIFSPQSFGTSPKIAATQGYATDGTNNFLFSTREIVETDSRWNIVYKNSAPFLGIHLPLAHVGDGEVSGGKIYAPLGCATQEKCTTDAVAIGVFSANIADLPLQQWADITSSGCDGSGIAVGPNNTLYISSFFVNPGILCLYDATTLESKGTLTLSAPIPRIQGISFDPASQRFAVTSDSEDRTAGYIYFVSLDGTVVGPVYTVPRTGELEGLDFTQGYLGYVIQPFDYVYFLYSIQITGSNFYPASQVQADGVAQPTTYENSELLDAIVPVSSQHGFGQVQITVVNPSPGGGTSSALPFTVTQSD